jgi:hypothetical protein
MILEALAASKGSNMPASKTFKRANVLHWQPSQVRCTTARTVVERQEGAVVRRIVVLGL